ncbi:MAG: polyphenol oxidase family protein [Actinomycetota bacterium]
MKMLYERLLDDGAFVHVAVTDRSDGDFAVGAPDVERRRRHLVDRPWRWLQQVHGAEVVDGDDPTVRPGVDGDAVLTSGNDVALAVQAADCVPIALVSLDGPIGVVHAGWRGLVAGVIEATAAELRRRSPGEVVAIVGPHIRPERYEFGAELDELVERFGPSVAGQTSAGGPALDLGAAVRVVLGEASIDVAVDDGRCTSEPELFSYRLAGDRERHALVAWRTA